VKEPHCRSGMAHVVKGLHSFTCTPTRLSMNEMNHACLCLPFPSQSWSSFTNPGLPRGMEGRVGLGITTVGKQSAHDCYVTAITAVSCSICHASLGKLEHRGASNSQPLGPQATMLTTADYESPMAITIIKR